MSSSSDEDALVESLEMNELLQRMGVRMSSSSDEDNIDYLFNLNARLARQGVKTGSNIKSTMNIFDKLRESITNIKLEMTSTNINLNDIIKTKGDPNFSVDRLFKKSQAQLNNLTKAFEKYESQTNQLQNEVENLKLKVKLINDQKKPQEPSE